MPWVVPKVVVVGGTVAKTAASSVLLQSTVGKERE